MGDDFFAAVIDGMGDGVIVVDRAGDVLVFNESARRLLGYPRTGEPIPYRLWFDSLEIHSLEGKRLAPNEHPVKRVLAGGPGDSLDLVVRGADHAAVVVNVTTRAWVRPGGDPHAIVVLRESKRIERPEHKGGEADVREIAAKMMALMDHLSTGVMFEGPSHRVEIVNRAYCAMFGIDDAKRVVGSSPIDAQHVRDVRDAEGFNRLRERRLLGGERAHADRIEMTDRRVLERDYVPIDVAGVVQGHFWSFRDVTERERAREHLAELSNRDELTGLYNRRGFTTLAEQWLRIAARTRKTPLLLFVDVNGMKPVNDRLGHATGDQLLRDTADLLRATFRDSDILARLGGDEFVVLAVDALPEHSTLLCDRLQWRVQATNDLLQRPYRLSLSVGVSTWDPAKPRSMNELLAEADARMYEAKRHRAGTSTNPALRPSLRA
ncbi:MAG: diguanylate cyclase [Polyangiaceae bacterium]|jgi:diguanylate cyclase (GGDEF)-like protein